MTMTAINMTRPEAIQLLIDNGFDEKNTKKMPSKRLFAKAAELAPKTENGNGNGKRGPKTVPAEEKFVVGVLVTTPEGEQKSYVLKYGSTDLDEMLGQTRTFVPGNEIFNENGAPVVRMVSKVSTAREICRNARLIPGCEGVRVLKANTALNWND